MNLKCLNCDSNTINNFCSVCGQKTSTHRFSVKHVVKHDFIHGVFHLDKGFIFTVKELFLRPGHSIREFIQGKRVNYFNYFTLIILIYAIGHLIGKIPSNTLAEVLETGPTKGNARVMREFGKYIILAGAPMYALASYLMFFKSKQNYTEHLVMTMYFTCGILFINFIPLFAVFFTSELRIVLLMNFLVAVLEWIYYFWFFQQYFSAFNYSKKELILRCIAIVLIIIIISGSINLVVNKIGLLYMN